MSGEQRSSLQNPIGIFAVYFILLIIGIPWYWPKDSDMIIMGVPGWVFVAVLVSFFTSVFTAFLLLRYPWQIEVDLDE